MDVSHSDLTMVGLPGIDLPGIQQFQMKGHVAIVTGGSKGLGLAMAAGLASAGASLLLLSRHGAECTTAAKAIAEKFQVDAVGLEADVIQPDSLDKAVAFAINRWGKIDVLLNSAGINIRAPIDVLSHDEFDQVMKTNVYGTWNACKAVVPEMKRALYGRIINMSSALGVVGLPDRSSYASSKGAIVQMTRTLGLELAPHKITCNAICPGPFLTEINFPIANSEQAKQQILGLTAMKRWGELKEIQGAAIYLASPASSYTTGSLLTVDAGWTAH